MKRFIIVLGTLFMLIGCENYSAQYKQTQIELSQARDSIKMLTATIEALSYPANQRMAKINSLIKEGKYDSATTELNKLVSLFPNSPEAKMEPTLTSKIDAGIKAKLAEEKRIKALGFKALKDYSTVSCGNVKAVFSNVSIGTIFTFDSYGDEYHYRRADKNNRYVTASMSISSQDNNPNLPQCAIYIVDGESLTYIESLTTRFSRWDDYGSYLGNYADYNNDFSKVNTVRFKIGAEILTDYSRRPFILVMKKENALRRSYDSYGSPEISYKGYVDFKATLSIEDFSADGQYVSIKRFNFEKL